MTYLKRTALYTLAASCWACILFGWATNQPEFYVFGMAALGTALVLEDEPADYNQHT